MNLLCITSNLTSSELASWVQAIGSIVAILAAAGIAIWSSKKQHQSALDLHTTELRNSKIEKVKTLLILSQNCAIAANHFTQELSNRDHVRNIATGEKHFDFEELLALQNGVTAIPIFQLPDLLVKPTMVLGADLRQFRRTVEIAIKEHRNMDAEHFGKFFQKTQDLTSSLKATEVEIEELLNEVIKSA